MNIIPTLTKYYSKYKNCPKPLKAITWFTISNFFQKGISIITVPIYAFYLSPDEYGKLSVFISWQQILLIFATFELSLGAFQRGYLLYKNNQDVFQASIVILSNVITFFLFALIFLFFLPIQKFTSISSYVFVLLFIYYIVEPGFTCWVIKNRFNYNYTHVSFVTIISCILFSIIPLFPVILYKPTAEIKICTTLIITIIFYIPFYFGILRYCSVSELRKNIIEYSKFCFEFQWPLLFHSLSFFALAQADRIMISKMIGNSEAAYYSVAHNLSNVLLVFQVSLNQVLKPWRYQKLECKDFSLIKMITSSALFLFFITILFFVILAPDILKLLFKPSYYEAVWSIPPISLSVIFIYLYSFYADIESYYSKTKFIMVASLLCCFVNFLFNYISLRFFTYIYCAYVTYISYILLSFFHYLAIRFLTKQLNFSKDLQLTKELVLCTLFSSVLMVIVTLTYSYPYLRYTFIIVLFVILFFQKKYILHSCLNIMECK